MRKLPILGLLTLVLLIGCKEEDSTAERLESFRGTYLVENPSVVGVKIDSMTMTIENNVRYRFVHYPFRPGREVNFCNSSGAVEEFGTNSAIFFPESIDGAECDSIRIPRDMFIADFRNHGDTIYLDRDDDKLVYEIRLLPR